MICALRLLTIYDILPAQDDSVFTGKDVAAWTKCLSLSIPIGTVASLLELSTGKSLSVSAAVYLAANIEYVAVEVIGRAGNAALRRGLGVLDNSSLARGIAADPDLLKLFPHGVLGSLNIPRHRPPEYKPDPAKLPQTEMGVVDCTTYVRASIFIAAFNVGHTFSTTRWRELIH